MGFWKVSHGFPTSSFRVSQDLRCRVGPRAHRGACFAEAGANGLSGAVATGEFVAHHMAGVKMPNLVGFNGILWDL